MTAPRDTIVLDVDGTLIDSNYQHALAWYRAFRRFDIVIPLWQLHRGIGMGGDQFVAHVSSDAVEAEHGEALREAWGEEFEPMLAEVAPLPGARDLLVAVNEAGFNVVLASSGKPEHVEHSLDLLDARELAEGWTTADDVEQTKPEPDLLKAALAKTAGANPVMVGDSVWDVEAAKRIDVPTLTLRTGGFSADELLEAGAADVFDSLVALRASIGTGLLTRPR